jgi:hypothetical protein
VDGLLGVGARLRVSPFVLTVVLSGFELENLARCDPPGRGDRTFRPPKRAQLTDPKPPRASWSRASRAARAPVSRRGPRGRAEGPFEQRGALIGVFVSAPLEGSLLVVLVFEVDVFLGSGDDEHRRRAELRTDARRRQVADRRRHWAGVGGRAVVRCWGHRASGPHCCSGRLLVRGSIEGLHRAGSANPRACQGTALTATCRARFPGAAFRFRAACRAVAGSTGPGAFECRSAPSSASSKAAWRA